MTVQDAIQRSAQQFTDVVWPNMAPLLGGGHVIPVEAVTNSLMAQTLDTLGGVDLWWVHQQQIFPVASRVQYGHQSWNSFTVRYSRSSGRPTEYHKRLQSLRTGSIYPKLTIQAYVNNGHLMAAAAVDTKHLIDLATQYSHQKRVNKADGATFIYVNWDQCSPDKIIKTEA